MQVQKAEKNEIKLKSTLPSFRRSRTVSTILAKLVRLRQFLSALMRLEVPTLMTCVVEKGG